MTCKLHHCLFSSIAELNVVNSVWSFYSKRLLCSSVNKRSSNEDTRWDVIISGGGMVGSAMACALGFSPVFRNKRILLLETSSSQQKTLPEKYANRVCSLNPGTRDLLTSFGAWENVCSFRMKPVKMLHIWEACSDALITFQHPNFSDDISYIVENDVILRSITMQLEKVKDTVTVLNSAKVVSYDLPSKVQDTNVGVTLQDGTKLNAKLLIGADGQQSLVRKSMGVKCISWNYNQKGIVATLNLSEPIQNNVAWQKFLTTGPVALLPLSEDKSSLVWCAPKDVADKLMQMDEDAFIDSLNSSLWDESKKNRTVEKAVIAVNDFVRTIFPTSAPIKQLPPNILSVEPGSRASFPLGLNHTTKYVSHRVALIGDAAHRVHPLAGLGVNLGFSDVKCLAEQLTESVYNGQEIGDSFPLEEYEMLRQRDIVPKMGTIDLLYRLYSTTLTPVVFARSLGLQLVNSIDPIKRMIIQRAST